MTWAGPLAPAAQFSCTGTLPALQAGQTHSNTAKVVGTGVTSGDTVDDSDDWHGTVPEDEGTAPESGEKQDANADADGVGAANGGPGASAQDTADAGANSVTPNEGGLAETGGSSMIALVGGAIALACGGLGLMLAMRRRRNS